MEQREIDNMLLSMIQKHFPSLPLSDEHTDWGKWLGFARAVYEAGRASPASAPEGFTMSEPTILPDGSGFGTMSFPLPKDHWIYKEREYEDGAIEPNDLPAPILTHSFRRQVIAAIRYAVRSATNCGKEDDFDPDALVQNAVYALCGPYGKAAPTPPENKALLGAVAEVVWYDPQLSHSPEKPGKIIDGSIAFMESAEIGTKLFAAPTPPVSEDRKDAPQEDYFADACRLALELECLLLDCKDTAVTAKWWDSAHEALEQHRERIAAMQEDKP